jgi:hypothetical protein
MRSEPAASRDPHRGRVNLVVVYYLATPLFALCDWIFGWNVRVSALDGQPGLKNTYYAVCTAAGVATYLRPALWRVVGLTESSINILLLVLGVMLPYWSAIAAFTGDQAFTPSFTPAKLLNFLISGLMWVNVFHRSIPGDPLGRPEP